MQNSAITLYEVGKISRCPGWTCGANLEGYSCGNYCCRGGRWLSGGACTVNRCPGWTCNQENQTCKQGYCCKGGRWRRGTCSGSHKGSWVMGRPRYRMTPSCNTTGHASKKIYTCEFTNNPWGDNDWGGRCREINSKGRAFLSNPRPKIHNITEYDCLKDASKTNNYRTRSEIARGISYSGGARQWIRNPVWGWFTGKGTCYVYDHAEACR